MSNPDTTKPPELYARKKCIRRCHEIYATKANPEQRLLMLSIIFQLEATNAKA